MELALDPVTRDYVDDGRGGFAEDRSSMPLVLHQLHERLGQWWGDPDAGSELHRLHQLGDSEQGRAELGNITQRALRPLAELGVISSLEVVVGRDELGRVLVRTSWQDLSTGETQVLDFHPFSV